MLGLEKVAMKIVFENIETSQFQTNITKEFKFHNLQPNLNIIQYYTMYSRIPFLKIPNSFIKFFPESYETKYFKNPKNGMEMEFSLRNSLNEECLSITKKFATNNNFSKLMHYSSHFVQ